MAIPGASGDELAVSEFIHEKLSLVGIRRTWMTTDSAHRRSPLQGNCGNLIVKLPGNRRAGRRLFSAHMDTVPLCVGSQPVRRGMLVRSGAPGTGLGADNRAGCAVLLHTLQTLVEQDLPRPPLTFCWFVQEEIGLRGSRHVSTSALGNPRLAVNWDGGSPAKLTIGATSGYRMTVEIAGLASHAGGSPEMGVSAIAVAGLAIADLHRNGWHGAIQQGGRQGTSNIGVISGGAATNVVADRVTLRIEARSHDAAFRDRIVREIKEAFQRAARTVKNVKGRCAKVRFDGGVDYEAYLLDSRHPAVTLVEQAVRDCGANPEHAVTNGGLDANWLVAHGIPTVSLGCGQKNQHTVEESLDLKDFLLACQVALRLATVQEH